jgi:hypothetical protein
MSWHNKFEAVVREIVDKNEIKEDGKQDIPVLGGLKVLNGLFLRRVAWMRTKMRS